MRNFTPSIRRFYLDRTLFFVELQLKSIHIEQYLYVISSKYNWYFWLRLPIVDWLLVQFYYSVDKKTNIYNDSVLFLSLFSRVL